MNKYDFLEEMNDNEALLFKKCLRKLLDTTFIVEEKDEKLYAYLAKESNRIDVSVYLKVIGYDIKIVDDLKVAMLVNDSDHEEESGLKRSNLLTFDGNQIKILLTLWQSYLSKCAKEKQVYITFSELIDRLKFYGITYTLNTSTFKECLMLFKRFNLINYTESDINDSGVIRLYPSLQFCMDIEQLKQVVKDYVPDASSDLMLQFEEEE